MAPTTRKRPSIHTGSADPRIHKDYTTKDVRLVRSGRPVICTVARSQAQSHPQDNKSQRQMQRQRLMKRVRDAGISKPPQTAVVKKRRRPGKKLIAAEDLDDMRDALRDIAGNGDGDEWQGLSDADTATQAGRKKRRRRLREGEGKIQMRSLQHRPGAMKRKRRMEGVEMERFGRNLAQLSANTKALEREVQGQDAEDAGGGGAAATSQEKWAALRAFIGSTMERDDGFTKV